MSFSLKDIPAGGAALPNGQYRVKFTDVEAGVSQTQNDKLIIKGLVVEGPQSDNKFTFSRSLQAKAIWKLRDDLINAGYDENVPFAHGPDNPQAFARDVRAVLVGPIFDLRSETTIQKAGAYAGKPQTEFTLLGKARLTEADVFDSV